MKSLVLTNDGLQLADTPIPPVLPGDVRIEVRSVGICRTDLSIWNGDLDAELPLVLGHEIGGVVHESSVPELVPGTPLTTEIDLSCGRCWYCKRQMRHLCPKRETLGITVDGGLSEFLSVPVELVHQLPEGVDPTTATFVEPLASAIETWKRSPAEEDEPIAVIGTGKIGILTAQVYDAFGAEVHLIGRNKFQLGLARQLGLLNTINTNRTEWREDILQRTRGVGPRIVVEATGSPEGMKMALSIVRSRGSVAVKSMHGKDVPLDTTDIVNREIEIVGTSRGPFEDAIDMLAKGRIEVRKLISREFRLESGAEAYEYASRANVSKVIINI
ncbi:alcohol dehydrogenase [Candidatus Thorarchaeota archaeon]|nr:MAG: alcohol dehydrogenase [Candidatus Thorarchaeota archaeon]